MIPNGVDLLRAIQLGVIKPLKWIYSTYSKTTRGRVELIPLQRALRILDKHYGEK